MSQSTGFVILRHVQNHNHNKLWTRSYDSIRKYYPEIPIVILDDNSDQAILDNKDVINTIIVNSKHPKRAELLPYIYYLNNKWFDSAIIIHDSIFMNSKINFATDDYNFFWTFDHIFNKPHEEKRILSHMKNGQDLLKLYDRKNDWCGCFGAISVINHDYLKMVNSKFDLDGLTPFIQTRSDRMCFERILGCVMNYFAKKPTLFGDIHQYGPWDIRYEEAIRHTYLPVIKAWSIRE